MPDSLILVPVSVMARVSAAPQLEALLSYAITSVLQKQAYRTSKMVYLTKHRTLPLNLNDVVGNTLSALKISQDEQLLRIGISRLHAEGL
jgi:hypothetical protein